MKQSFRQLVFDPGKTKSESGESFPLEVRETKSADSRRRLEKLFARYVSFGHEIPLVLVEPRAVSLNPVDGKLCAKATVTGHPLVPGFDGAGVVLQADAGADRFPVGSRVFYAGLPGADGALGEAQWVPAHLLSPLPEKMRFAEGAGLALVGLTALEGLGMEPVVHQFLYARRQGPAALEGLAQKFTKGGNHFAGEEEAGAFGRELLLIGAAGGVGSLVSQLAARVGGFRVTGTAGRPETLDWSREYGCHRVVRHVRVGENGSGLSQPLTDKTKFARIFCCADPSGWLETMASLLAPRGVITAIVDATRELDLNRLKPLSARWQWEFMFTRGLNPVPGELTPGEILDFLAWLVSRQILRVPLRRAEKVDSLVSQSGARRVSECLAEIVAGQSWGKTVLEI